MSDDGVTLLQRNAEGRLVWSDGERPSYVDLVQEAIRRGHGGPAASELTRDLAKRRRIEAIQIPTEVRMRMSKAEELRIFGVPVSSMDIIREALEVVLESGERDLIEEVHAQQDQALIARIARPTNGR